MSHTNVSKIQNDVNKLRSALYNNIIHVLQTLRVDKEVLQYFNLDMITVRIEGDKPVGSVQCAFCIMKNLKTKNKMHTVRVKAQTHFWITSNFKKHIEKDIINVRKMQSNDTIKSKNESIESMQPRVPESNDGIQLSDEHMSTEHDLSGTSLTNNSKNERIKSMKPLQVIESPEVQANTLRSKLYNHIIHLFQSNNIEKSVLKYFKIDMITINVEGSNPFGSVECVLCSMSKLKSRKKGKKSKKKLHTIRVKPQTNFWILSNFKKHIKKHLIKVDEMQSKDTIKSKNERIESMKPRVSESNNGIQLGDEPVNDEHMSIKHDLGGTSLTERNLSGTSLTESLVIDENNQIDPYSTENSHNEENPLEAMLNECNQPINSDSMEYSQSLIGLSIQRVDLHSIMYDQISEQLLHMNECVTRNKNKRKQSDMVFKLQNKPCSLKTFSIPEDGNCMFTSIAHQLYGKDNDGSQIMVFSEKLRAEVVAFIKKKFSKFEGALKDRIRDQYPNDPNMTCQMIIKKLSVNGYWGGYETLTAVIMLYNINIMIINERGDFYFNDPFDMNRGKTILLSYRLKRSSNFPNKRIHYESIVHIDQNDIYTMTQIKSKSCQDEVVDVNC